MKITDTPSIERLKERLAELLFEHGPMCGRENCLHTAAEIAPILIERLAALETLAPSAGEVERLSQANRDCIAKAKPGEPMFIILGRDPDGANIVKLWADRRAAAGDLAHAETVWPVAEAMLAWAADPANAPESAPPPEAYPALASPPPQPDIEGRARELLASALDEPNGAFASLIRYKKTCLWVSGEEALRAIAKALSALPTTEIRREAEPGSYIEWQQRRGMLPDTIDWAINEYDDFMTDDNFDAQGVLDRIVSRLREIRSLGRP